MSYRFIKSLPSCAKAYVPRLLNKSGVREELFGKPILVIGDVPVSESISEYDNISKCIDYPTMTLINRIPKDEEKVVGVGKFEIHGSLNCEGNLFIEDVGYGQADVFSKKYAEYVKNNPVFARLYEMQNAGKRVVSPFFISHVNEETVRDYCELPKSAAVNLIMSSANDMLEMNINSYFDFLFLNGTKMGNNDVEPVIKLFETLTIPIRYVSVSGTCPLTDIQEQRSVRVAQAIFNAVSKNQEEISYSRKPVDKYEGKGRVISMISKPRS